MALEIMKNGLAKKQNKGTISSRGAGGSRRNGPRTISKYFFIFEPFPKEDRFFVAAAVTLLDCFLVIGGSILMPAATK